MARIFPRHFYLMERRSSEAFDEKPGETI